MRELRGRVTTKVADATDTMIGRYDQFLRAKPLSIPHPLAMCPILTEEAVKRASVIKDRKIFKPIFWPGAMGKFRIPGTRPTRTDPICHAIGWQLIIIPAYISFPTGDPLKNTIFLSPQATIAPASFRDLALIDADLT
jgi:hypothetical protein